MTVRFSDSTGIPNIPDGSANAKPHGIAIKYHLPNGSDTDMVINSFKFFPVATGEDFRDLLLALAASPPDAPKPTKFDQFATSHPSVPAAFGVSMDRAVREGHRALRMSVKSSDCTNRSIALSAKSASSTTARAREASKNTNPKMTK